MSNPTVLLHISDIHFQMPLCTTNMDPYRPFRTMLLQDVRDRVQTIGDVRAILVSGDIAYKGVTAEYEVATAWLFELAAAGGCKRRNIYVVPGNHDVDRNVINSNASVRNAQQAILRAEPPRRQRELLVQFQDTDAGRALLLPIQEYNNFAAQFDCQLYSPDRLFWQQDLALDEQTVLRMYGLTSTLLSGAGFPNHRDDTRDSLYLSPLQTALDPVGGVINLVMCHHPPDWFADHDDVDDAINGRAALHLFGHKHRQRITRDYSFIRFSAGAVNPDRAEPLWEPGYNLIKLTTTEDGGRRFLDVEVQLLVWQTSPDKFKPKLDENDEEIFRHRIAIRGASSPRAAEAQKARIVEPMEELERRIDCGDATTQIAARLEGAMTEEWARDLVFRFWNLASSQRRELTKALGLIDDADMQQPEPERYRRALLRAKERGLVEQLANEVTKRERS